MSLDLQDLNASSAADAAAGVLISLPFRRERVSDWGDEPASKKTKTFDATPPQTTIPPMTAIDAAVKTFISTSALPGTVGLSQTESTPGHVTTKKGRDPVVRRKTRLEQNRRAAKESRQRKKCMIEELQRSVIFFSRANTTLKQQNDELSRLVIEAQDYVSREGAESLSREKAGTEPKNESIPKDAGKLKKEEYDVETSVEETAKVLVQLDQVSRKKESIVEDVTSLNVETSSSVTNAKDELSAMQPGSTMQAMASFQQAATVAMEEAMKGLKNNTGMNFMQLSSPAALVVGANAQQAYTDTMTAIAMQQAAAAAVAAGHHQALMMSSFPFMMGPMFAWQLQQQQQQYQMFQQQIQQDNRINPNNEAITKSDKP